MTARFDHRAAVAAMPPAEAVDYLLAVIDEIAPPLSEPYAVTVGGCRVPGVPLAILRALWRAPGRSLSRAALWSAVYGGRPDADGASDATLSVHVLRLRRMLAGEPRLRIVTEWGWGYRLDAAPGCDPFAEPRP